MARRNNKEEEQLLDRSAVLTVKKLSPSVFTAEEVAHLAKTLPEVITAIWEGKICKYVNTYEGE